MNAKGKKPTVNQCKIMKRNFILFPKKEYLVIKDRVEQDERILVVKNRLTGSIKEIREDKDLCLNL